MFPLVCNSRSLLLPNSYSFWNIRLLIWFRSQNISKDKHKRLAFPSRSLLLHIAILSIRPRFLVSVFPFADIWICVCLLFLLFYYFQKLIVFVPFYLSYLKLYIALSAFYLFFENVIQCILITVIDWLICVHAMAHVWLVIGQLAGVSFLLPPLESQRGTQISRGSSKHFYPLSRSTVPHTWYSNNGSYSANSLVLSYSSF